MKKLLLLLVASVAFSFSAVAQDDAAEPAKPWTKGGMGSLTFNQVGLFNWAAGGQSNMTLIGNLNMFANRTWENAAWENSLDLAYGFIKNNFIFQPDAPITKAEDKIEFNSKYGKKAWSEKVYYTALLSFRSQFDYGYATPGAPVYISKFLAPGYLTFGIGLDYKPNSDLSLFLSPISGKITIVSDDSLAAIGGYGVNQRVDPEDITSAFRPGARDKSRFEFGATFRAKYKKNINENLGVESNLEMFSNYIDRPQNIDVRWSNAFIAKITKYLTVNLFTDMIYDHDVDIPLVNSDGTPNYSINPEPMLVNGIPTPGTTFWPGPGYLDGSNPFDASQVQKKGPRLQFKQVFGLGLSYKF